MKIKHFKYKFVSLIEKEIEEGIIYISIPYNVAIHKCACGCGEKVITPLDPNQWSFIYDGEDISLYPSIGNWSYKCKSHYIIKKGMVLWVKDCYYQDDLKCV
jgi:hypothetical protein